MIFFCFVSIAGCNKREDKSYADCILNNSDKFTSEAGTAAIEAACREKFPEPEAVVESSEPEKPLYRKLTPDELAKVNLTKDWVSSYLPGMANDAAHIASGQGAKLDWRISLQVENDLNLFLRAVQFELFTGGSARDRLSCALSAGWATSPEDELSGCAALTAYNEIVEVNIPPQGLREVEIPVARDCCIVRVIGAVTDNPELE